MSSTAPTTNQVLTWNAVMVGNTNFTLGGNDLTDAVQITLTGHASVVDGVNNIVSACLTLDGASCKGNTNTYTLGTSDSTICVPTASSCNSSTSGNRPIPGLEIPGPRLLFEPSASHHRRANLLRQPASQPTPTLEC